ncbi:hypothetical protein GE09DRAFT_506088 [Coniochaeta sp. 2T2.1]|nr:hypothetical protein GE09DRAFT_506088 [Coniochaeta sp. 2T2.1]
MGYNQASDEGLPEVVTDPSPQALTSLEEQQRSHQQDQHDKYHVVYDDAPKLPGEVNYDQVHPEFLARSPVGSVPWETLAAGEGSAGGQENNSEKAVDEPSICGVRRKVFFLLLIAALVVVGAAIGGGVGGGVAAARSREGSGSAASSSTSTSSTASTPPSTETSSTTTTSSSTSTTSTTPSPSPEPTFLNNQTGPLGFGFQGFSGINYTGNVTDIYRDEGFFDFGWDVSSYVWLPNGTSCCVTFCEDHHNATGYRCQARKREESSGGFPRIYIWCDPHLQGIANGTCS